jgi:hypothetical protein
VVKTQPSASPPRDGEKDREMEGYEQDFYAWTKRTAELLRARRFDEADIEHVAEEIEAMGRRDVRELNSRMQVLLGHLLKWQVQPDRRSASWRGTISAQRQEIDGVLEQSPTLRPVLARSLSDNYARAVKRATAETGLGDERFPGTCPYRVDQVLDEDYLP